MHEASSSAETGAIPVDKEPALCAGYVRDRHPRLSGRARLGLLHLPPDNSNFFPSPGGETLVGVVSDSRCAAFRPKSPQLSLLWSAASVPSLTR